MCYYYHHHYYYCYYYYYYSMGLASDCTCGPSPASISGNRSGVP